jgi:hypothetical protein
MGSFRTTTMEPTYRVGDRVRLLDENYNYFGVCPDCNKTDGYTNIGAGHWFFCKEHKTRWCIGSNLFSSWRDETEEEQRREYDELDFGSFKDVEPLTIWLTGTVLKVRPSTPEYPDHFVYTVRLGDKTEVHVSETSLN